MDIPDAVRAVYTPLNASGYSPEGLSPFGSTIAFSCLPSRYLCGPPHFHIFFVYIHHIVTRPHYPSWRSSRHHSYAPHGDPTQLVPPTVQPAPEVRHGCLVHICCRVSQAKGMFIAWSKRARCNTFVITHIHYTVTQPSECSRRYPTRFHAISSY